MAYVGCLPIAPTPLPIDATQLEPGTRTCSVVVVDDEPAVLQAVHRILSAAGLQVCSFGSSVEALAALETYDPPPQVLLADLGLATISGLDLIESIGGRWPDIAVLIMTGDATVSSAVEAMRRGAYDYLTKPFGSAALLGTVQRAIERQSLVTRNRQLTRQVGASRLEGLFGNSVGLQRVFSLIDAVAPSDTTVLILGESGTGKELVARAIHNCGPRKLKPFLAINCGALAESVLDSELFGHVRGAFTGAVGARKGLFEEASGGTIFLDEVGELPASLQVKLLRVLQEHEVRPVGSNEVRHVDIRVLAATNRDLLSATRDKSFREDLYYRLNVVCIEVPPLRERPADIGPIVHHFLRKYSRRLDKPIKTLTPQALELLTQYSWPGNVRELENAIERSTILAPGDVITADLLPAACRENSTSPPVDASSSLPLAQAVRQYERGCVQHALARAGGNLAEAARLAGVDRSNFRRLVKRHGLGPALPPRPEPAGGRN